jgi:TonB family protein
MLFLRALFLSLAVHFLLVVFIDLGAPYFSPKAPASRPSVTEIELVPSKPPAKPTKKERQIVRQAVVPKSQLKEDDTDLARFLSADRQRVKQETQAAQTGMTQNRQQSSPQKQARKETPKDMAPEGVDIAKNLQEYARTVEAPSTVGEALPQDVSIGSFTSLNTDRYVYYSFYARIEDLIRFRWESRVRQAVDRFDRNYLLGVIGQKNWVTSVDIWLNKEGRFHSAHILKESGVPQFDQAATMAFKEAGMFSNPPAEMVEDDGYIHLRYNFSVRFRPSAIVYQNN